MAIVIIQEKNPLPALSSFYSSYFEIFEHAFSQNRFRLISYFFLKQNKPILSGRERQKVCPETIKEVVYIMVILDFIILAADAYLFYSVG